MKQLNKHPWQIESLRITSFLDNDFNFSILESWFKEISKTEPLSINKSNSYFQGRAQIKSAMLNMEWNFNRIDLFLNSNAPTIENNIGAYSDLEQLMNDVIFGFFSCNCPVSKRLALGIILNTPINDFDEGADVLEPKLKSVKNIKGTTDFLFRINRPFISETIRELKLNRLMTWSLGYLQFLKMPIIIGQRNFVQQNVQQDLKPDMICRLEMDFNTVESEGVVLLPDQQKAITIELLKEAMKVAEKGEYWD